jgi:hypothetical protein
MPMDTARCDSFDTCNVNGKINEHASFSTVLRFIATIACQAAIKTSLMD